jgi:hypothetical protein
MEYVKLQQKFESLEKYAWKLLYIMERQKFPNSGETARLNKYTNLR